MRLNELDLNLLVVFEAILRCGSVTDAADAVGLTQPSMSNALQRLREHFGDPLFVRVKGAMRPTPLAESLAAPVQSALAQLRAALEGTRGFVPAQSTRCFRICMTDIAQRLLLAPLIGHFAVHAPGVVVETVDMYPGATQAALASGEIDLAVGYFASFGSDFHSQRFFQETYVAMVRRGHPAILDGAFPAESYLQAKHIVYVPSAASHHTLEGVLDREFLRLGRKRNVGLRVAHSLGTPNVVESTDLVLTVPSRLGSVLAESFDVEVFPLPLTVPAIDIKQYWHARYHHDPAIAWLREQFRGLFQANIDAANGPH